MRGPPSARSPVIARAARGLVVVLVVACAGRTAGATLEPDARAAVFAEAIEAYDRGIAQRRTRPDEAQAAFREAAARFRVLVDDGVENGRLHYNLGNAQLQSGALGPAILSYRRAERLIPRDARLRSNLEHARAQCRVRVKPSGGRALADALLWWHRNTALRSRTIAFGIAWTLLWLLLVARLFARSTILRNGAILAAVLALGLGASVTAPLLGVGDATVGVVIRDDVIVRKGNGNGYEPQLEEPLHEGVEFELCEQRGDWLLIELADGNRGWIRTESADLI